MDGGTEARTVGILLDATRPDGERAEALLPLVYEQLRAGAQRMLAGERAGHTLSATALVHEAYVRLVGARDVAWSGRAHFYAAAVEAMRRILIDHARARGGRGVSGREARMRALRLAGLGEGEIVGNLDGLAALDGALVRLEGVDARAAAVVRLRFYAGLELGQAALALGISERTAKRDWAFARGWLRSELERGEGE